MNSVKVSVIMPVYNAGKYLEKCLQSVVNQSLADIEIICVDDGSTDNSLDILNDFAKRDKRFKIITQQNQFAGVARNNGMRAATGKYFVFWDSDDFFEKNALSVMYKRCESKNADVCLCGAYRFDTEKNSRSIDESFLKKRFLPRKDVFSKETNGKYIFNMASNVPWQRMYRASFIKEHEIQFQNLRQANDTYFVMMSMFYAQRITATEKPLVNYRVNNRLSITGKASKNPLCAYESFKAVYDKLKTENVSGDVWQSFYNKLIQGLCRSILLQTTQNGIEAVYNKIKDEGFDYFGLTDRLNSEYFYFKNEFEDMMFIREHSASEYLLYKFQKENSEKLYYKSRMEKTLKIRIARRISRFISADSPLFERAKKLLHFR